MKARMIGLLALLLVVLSLSAVAQSAVPISIEHAEIDGTDIEPFGVTELDIERAANFELKLELNASEKVNVFAAINFDNISQEMAQGQGEHLTSLATLMGIPADQHNIFFTMVQEKYTTLIQAGETSPKAVVKAMYGAIDNHPVLAQVSISK